jgi:hypothetical protein
MDTFRNLPLTPKQNAEVLAYIAAKEATGEPWDTLELSYMLKDMLQPPPLSQ